MYPGYEVGISWGEIPQPFTITTLAIESQKQIFMWFAENFGVWNVKGVNDILFRRIRDWNIYLYYVLWYSLIHYIC